MSTATTLPNPMTQEDQDKAKALFKAWFAQHPDVKNPSDINCQTKYDYFMKSGWENLQLMQRARKSNVEQYGYPSPWTKPEFWLE
jgi:hypothetical protein